MKPIILLKPGMITPDTYYRVYHQNNRLLFIKVGGQFYLMSDKETYSMNIIDGIIHFIIWLFYEKNQTKRTEKLTKIDRQMEQNPEALLAKRHNFALELGSISSVTVSKRSTIHTGWDDNGIVQFHLANGRKRKFIIPSSISFAAVADILQTLDIPIKK